MRVMLIDDHPLIVSALQRILRELDEQVTIVPAGSAADARAALRADAAFDLLLLDLALPDTDGHAFLAELRRTHPSLPVVVVSASERAADVVRAIDAGAMGFVTKRATARDLLDALRAVLQGVIVVPDALTPEPLPEPDAVAALALRYLRKREETRTLVTALKDSKLPGAARAAELLGRSGTRAALEDFD